jgi:ADP-L-glycero-D-manno-heptose 6-epimerase
MLLSCELLEACIARDIPFIYASSASVYGLGASGFSEDTPLAPLNYYAISKAYFDTVVSQKIIDNPNAKIVGLRYFNVYGSGEEHKGDMASPIHKFFKQAGEKGEIQIFKGSENYLRDFIHVSDIVRITKNAISLAPGIYNVGTGKARSFYDVANIISNITGAAIKEIPFPAF